MKKSVFEFHAIDYISGVFVLFAIIGAGMFFFKDTYNSHPKEVQYYTKLSKAYGVAKGSNILYLDLPIGKVDDVTFADSQRSVKVTFTIENRYTKFITIGSELNISSSVGMNSIITGKSLILLKNNKNKEVYKAGKYIKINEPDSSNIITKADSLIENLSDKNGKLMKTINNLESLTRKLNQQATVDILLGKNSSREIRTLVTTLTAFPVDINTSINHLIKELQYKVEPIIQNTQTITKNVNDVTSGITNTIIPRKFSNFRDEDIKE